MCLRKEKVSYKVLFFVDRLRVGGIQMLLLNLLENFDPSIIKCEFLVLDDGENYEYEDRFENLGANVYKLKKVWLDSAKGYAHYCKAMDAFFKRHHDYVAVHMNASSKNCMLLYYAKKYGINKRIVHSHNTGFQTRSKLKVLVGDALKIPMKAWATDYFACSVIAGEWLFGKKEVEDGKVYIMPNAINIDKFQFRSEIRAKARRKLDVGEDTIIVGHVGRFTEQKNHRFLLQIFSSIHRMNPSAVLIMAGIGELMEQCKQQAVQLGLTDNILFLGFRDDIIELTQAMDVFLMPSFYEGFPVTGIEAQAAGCPCVFSDTITKEAALLDQSIYISLDESPDVWAKKTLDIATHGMRQSSKNNLKEKGFDIQDTVRYLEKYYIT